MHQYDLKLLSTTPFTRVNDLIPIQDKYLLDIFNNIPLSLTIDNLSNDLSTRFQFTKLQESFVYVATETVFHYPCAFVSEKSFKGITAKRPFILVAPDRTLTYLKELGFKTFDKFWDESYDLESNPELRLIKIVDVINTISTYSINELTTLLIDMESIIEHNFNFYKTSLFNNELAKFKGELTCLKLKQ